MTFEEVLHWCIFRSPGTTAKSAAEFIGISGQQFGNWRNHKKTNKFPTDEQVVKIAELCDLEPLVVWDAVQFAKCKNPEIQEALKSRITPLMQEVRQ